jgi:hypothetical protein
MSTLVERLRSRHWIEPDINGPLLAERYIDPDCKEAADRIEALEAERAAVHYTQSVGARVGMVEKVIITDGGDSTCFVWEHGKG